MALTYNIRNKEGYLTAAVSPRLARRLIEEYIGIWTTKRGQSVYEFKTRGCYGNGDVGIYIFPGTYIEMG